MTHDSPLDTPLTSITDIPSPPCSNPSCLLAATHDGECLTQEETA